MKLFHQLKLKVIVFILSNTLGVPPPRHKVNKYSQKDFIFVSAMHNSFLLVDECPRCGRCIRLSWLMPVLLLNAEADALVFQNYTWVILNSYKQQKKHPVFAGRMGCPSVNLPRQIRVVKQPIPLRTWTEQNMLLNTEISQDWVRSRNLVLVMTRTHEKPDSESSAISNCWPEKEFDCLN